MPVNELAEVWKVCIEAMATGSGVPIGHINIWHLSFFSVVWEPMGDGKKVISLADSHILLWDLQASSSQAVVSKKDKGLNGWSLELDFLGWIQNTLPPPHIWNFEINYCIGMMQGRRCRELSARPCGSKRKALWNGTEPHWGWLQVQVCSFHKAFLKPHLRRDTYAGLIPHCWLASPAFTWVLKMNLSTFLGVSLFLDTHFEYFAFCRAKYCVYFSCLIP